MIGAELQSLQLIVGLWGSQLSLKVVKPGTAVSVSSQLHSRFSTSTSRMEVSSQPGHGLISFIDASPTRENVLCDPTTETKV